MTATVIDGKAIAAKVLDSLKPSIDSANPPRLEVVIVGDDPASHTYVRNKAKAAAKVGIIGETVELPSETTQGELLDRLDAFNRDPSVHGILVQVPLPPHISERAVQEAIAVGKDVDCFHPHNLGRVMRGDPLFLPATPAGIMTMLREHDVALAGKRVTVVGRSNIVGRPLSVMLSQKGADATVTLVHSRTDDLGVRVAEADIVVAAAGSPGLIRGDWIREGAVVIDVGTNSIPDPSRKSGTRLVGDVDFEGASQRASLISPVPGGVGPMTIASLMENVVRAKTLSVQG